MLIGLGKDHPAVMHVTLIPFKKNGKLVLQQAQNRSQEIIIRQRKQSVHQTPHGLTKRKRKNPNNYGSDSWPVGSLCEAKSSFRILHIHMENLENPYRTYLCAQGQPGLVFQQANTLETFNLWN